MRIVLSKKLRIREFIDSFFKIATFNLKSNFIIKGTKKEALNQLIAAKKLYIYIVIF